MDVLFLLELFVANENHKEQKMNKSLIILVAIMFTIALLSVACDEGNSACSHSDSNKCANEAMMCLEDQDPDSGTYIDDITACNEDWCDCLHNACD
jgi:hypothetical protein